MIRTWVQTKEQDTFKRRKEEEDNVRHRSEQSVNECLEDALDDACCTPLPYFKLNDNGDQ